MSMDTIKSLKKENDDLKAQTESIMEELKKAKDLVNSKEGDHICSTSNKETLKSVEYLSKEYDDQKRFTQAVKQQISRLETRVTEIAVKLDSLSNSIDEVQQYSYQYNIKLMGIPEIKANESATETSVLCERIFKAMGVQVSLMDIDIAHRVATRNPNSRQPKPIICKFVRRLAREQVMAKRRDVRRIDPASIGLRQDSSLMDAGIFDHLTPRLQQLLVDAKKFKIENDYKFCWTKNSVIYLRRYEDSQPIRIKQRSDLERLPTGTN